MTIYSSGGLGTSCPIINNIKINEDNQKTLVIYPNPSNDIINISTGNIFPKSIDISNLICQPILSINIINSLNTTLDLKDEMILD